MPTITGALSEYEMEYLRLYRTYNDKGLTDGQLRELSEIARLLYPVVSDRLGFRYDGVMIKAAYNIAITGGKRAGYLVYTDRGLRVEYMRYKAVEHLNSVCNHHRDRRYRSFKVVSLDGLLDKDYHFNKGLKCRYLGGRARYDYVVYG